MLLAELAEGGKDYLAIVVQGLSGLFSLATLAVVLRWSFKMGALFQEVVDIDRRVSRLEGEDARRGRRPAFSGD